MKIITFYLPQYHTIPENDEWWGKGFTEWENLKKAKPLFFGHKQPKIPLENNYYNLLDEKVIQWQIQLAKKYGIYGFCFYHYWFNGKLLLEKPIEIFLENKNLNLPFCLCWANPSWTKAWVSKSDQVLIEQIYGDEPEWEKHFQYLLPFLKDPRYIKNSNGLPFVVIYDPDSIENLEKMLKFWKRMAVTNGLPGLEFAYQYLVPEKKEKYFKEIFDYCIEFQPAYALKEKVTSNSIKKKYDTISRSLDSKFYSLFGRKLSEFLFLKVRRYDYDEVWKQILNNKCKNEMNTLLCAFVDWDNTPRRGTAGKVLVGGSPKKFEKYLSKLIAQVKLKNQDLLFLTAWNEWSEGCYLEPDQECGFKYLEAIKDALDNNHAFPEY